MLNLQHFIMEQRSERYRSFIVYGPPLSCKSTFARKLAKTCCAHYMDLLAEAQVQEWSQRIDDFSLKKFRKWLLDHPSQETVVIVDNIDFLLNTWGDGEREEFIAFVDKLNNTETTKIYIFVIQDDAFIGNCPIADNEKGMSRIIPIHTIQDLQEV